MEALTASLEECMKKNSLHGGFSVNLGVVYRMGQKNDISRDLIQFTEQTMKNYPELVFESTLVEDNTNYVLMYHMRYKPLVKTDISMISTGIQNLLSSPNALPDLDEFTSDSKDARSKL